jgi:hypothetical protein
MLLTLNASTAVFAQAARPAAAAKGPLMEPATQWTGMDWANQMKEWLEGSRVVGKPEIYMINGTGRDLRVECEQTGGRHWTIVGSNPYIKGNSEVIRAWKATEESTQGFDGYCDEIAGYASNDDRYPGVMSKAKDFTGSAFITFYPKQ